LTVLGLAAGVCGSALACPDVLPAVDGARQVAQASGLPSRPAKKRAAPAVVEPVVAGGVRYEPLLGGKSLGLGQNGGDIVARDAATGTELWRLRVYTIEYRPNLEADKQDIFISEMSLAPDGVSLSVTDERGRRYRVDTRTKSVEVQK
jgi:hypothetical protein